MRGLCDFRTAYDEHPRLKQFTQHACQTLNGTIQTFLLSRCVLRQKIPGLFVECGIAAGAQLACMALAMTRENDRRVIHAFDSFQGIPHAGPQDDQQPGVAGFMMDRSLSLAERLQSTGVSKCSLDAVKTLWESWNFSSITIQWHEGWFQHTLPGTNLGPIAFLRLDGDLYESTKCCLEHLYDRVVPGGLTYIDDWGLGGCKKALDEFLEQRQLSPELLQDAEGNTGAVYWIK